MKKNLLASFALPIIMLVGCTKSIENQQSERNASLNKADKKNGNGTVWVQNIQLSGLNEVPPNDLGSTGVAILRITADKVLHSKVMVDYLVPGDRLTASHIHTGAAGTNGPVYVFLCHNADEFGENMEAQLTDAQYNALMDQTRHFYVNAHSIMKPAGLVRGQIR